VEGPAAIESGGLGITEPPEGIRGLDEEDDEEFEEDFDEGGMPEEVTVEATREVGDVEEEKDYDEDFEN